MYGNLHIYGNHRGGTGLVCELPGNVARLYDRRWVLADAKPGRSEALARLVTERFPDVDPRPFTMTAREAHDHSESDDTVVAALDTLGATRELLARRKPAQRMSFQLVGRGPGGVAGSRLAIGGMLTPHDSRTPVASDLLLGTIEGMTRDGSSRDVTRPDPLTASVLAPMRRLALRQTIRQLAEPGREPDDASTSPLFVVLGMQTLPLALIAAASASTHRQRSEAALEAAELLPQKHWAKSSGQKQLACIAVVMPKERGVDFFTIAKLPGRSQRVHALTVLEQPRPELRTEAPVAPAAFTD